MQESYVKQLQSDFPALKHRRITQQGDLLPGDWFFFRANPRPFNDEICNVIHDIINDNVVFVGKDLKVGHSRSCTYKNHNINRSLEIAAGSIPDRSFDIAIWEGHNCFRFGQPIAFSLRPLLSYHLFPDHPHISTFGYLNSGSVRYTVPYSLCYDYRDRIFEGNDYEKVHNSLQQIGIWLFRHQLWLTTRKMGNPIWIGDQINAEPERQFFYFRDPYLPCRCGLPKNYLECHLEADFLNAVVVDSQTIHWIFNSSKFDLMRYNIFLSEYRLSEQNIMNQLAKLF